MKATDVHENNLEVLQRIQRMKNPGMKNLRMKNLTCIPLSIEELHL
jgi:hypothetical protein